VTQAMGYYSGYTIRYDAVLLVPSPPACRPAHACAHQCKAPRSATCTTCRAYHMSHSQLKCGCSRLDCTHLQVCGAAKVMSWACRCSNSARSSPHLAPGLHASTLTNHTHGPRSSDRIQDLHLFQGRQRRHSQSSPRVQAPSACWTCSRQPTAPPKHSKLVRHAALLPYPHQMSHLFGCQLHQRLAPPTELPMLLGLHLLERAGDAAYERCPLGWDPAVLARYLAHLFQARDTVARSPVIRILPLVAPHLCHSDGRYITVRFIRRVWEAMLFAPNADYFRKKLLQVRSKRRLTTLLAAQGHDTTWHQNLHLFSVHLRTLQQPPFTPLIQRQ